MKKLPAFLFILVCNTHLWALADLPLREKMIPGSTINLLLDSLSIVEDSFLISGPDGLPLDTAFYKINFITTQLNLRVPEYWHHDTIIIRYRVWPINFSTPLFLKDPSLINLPGPGESIFQIPDPQINRQSGIINFDGLQSSGSITRGIGLGNRQDPSLDSDMNLQLSGWLAPGIGIRAAVSDRNIPFQADGTTRTLQEFDKVFITVEAENGSLTAGDFDIEKPSSHFLILNRKVRGASVSWHPELGDSLTENSGKLTSTAAGAISRGKFTRNQIQGVEGNQGPYRLQGNNNESFIIILSGSERVFVDGRLLERGMNNDYTIDYNTAELVFMPRTFITRDSRIVVEFEYAERNYARSVLYSGTGFVSSRGSLNLNFYSEQDHPSQPLFQSPDELDREILESVGDQINTALAFSYDSTGFQPDRAMYRMIDTLGYQKVFVFSINPETAHFQPFFSFLGEGKGNYIQINSAANGRVFQWLAPVDGIPQGTHDPVRQLVAPASQRMLTLGGNYHLTKGTQLSLEYALSDQDANLYSNRNDNDNTGHAFRISTQSQSLNKPDTEWELTVKSGYEMVNSRFTSPERFRSIEFERDWNLTGPLIRSESHLGEISLQLIKGTIAQFSYSASGLLAGENYQGLMNQAKARIKTQKNHLEYTGSLLTSESVNNSQFYRHRVFYNRMLRLFTAGIDHQIENNRIKSNGDLLSTSQKFNLWELYLMQPEYSKYNFKLFLRTRTDELPQQSGFSRAATANDAGLMYQLINSAHGQLLVRAHYRNLKLSDHSQNNAASAGNTFNTRFDYSGKFAGEAISTTLFYESSSGRERRKEYIYLEVPAGQGSFVWNDYNGNSIAEQDEFELSPYQQEANYIRVWVPTEGFIPVHSTVISNSINLDPNRIWRETPGIAGFVARFSNRFNYRIDIRRTGEPRFSWFNPYNLNTPDSILAGLNYSLRNSLFFDRSNPLYSAEWTISENRTHSLLSNGFDYRENGINLLRIRFRISSSVSVTMLAEQGTKGSESEFSSTRNYKLVHQKLEPSIIWQPGPKLRFSLFAGVQNTTNQLGEENSIIQQYTLENRIRIGDSGNLTLRIQTSAIDYPFQGNTPVAFEMLQGMRSGINHLLNINWQQNINSYMQLSLQYQGRKPPGVPFIHTGSIQLRALF